ncbi:hypothetical protein ACA910_008547 [Epithemia clementina (nom. ined.)]
MKLQLVLLMPLAVCCSVFRRAAGASSNDESNNESIEKKCSIFIAPSSLHGNAGFGVYTNRNIKEGEAILSGPPGTPDGPALPVVDPSYGFNPAYTQWNDVFGHYWWGRGVPEYTRYEAKNVMDFQITFGALPNHNCILGSLDMHFPTRPEDAYDDSLSNRFRDPGAGAYSYHRGRIFYTNDELPAGSEIFLSYGYCSREDLENPGESRLWYPEWTHFIPMREDFQAATRATLAMWNELLSKHNFNVSEIPDGAALSVEASLDETLSSHARSLLPTNTSELKAIMSNGKAQLTKNLARQFGTTQRTAQWVEENGLCIEHLIPGTSGLPQAGRGAFAQHTIRQGEIVVPVPLLHIMDKSVMFLIENEEDGKVSNSKQQLLTNYCFTHRHSSLMLCPTSNAILINHCSARTKECGEKGPNAFVRWASPEWDPRTEVWLNATLEKMAPNLDRMLGMEIVALRDIEPGEEVFFDYGEEWEQAWQSHVQAWQPERPDEVESYFSIAEANNESPDKPLKYLVSNTIRGGEVDHPYIFTGCLYWPTEWDEDDVFQNEDEIDFESMTDRELLDQYADDGSRYQLENDREMMESHFWPCSVLREEYANDREEGEEVTYLVRITQHPSLESQPWDIHQLPRFLYHFPRSSIRYFAKPYKSDAFLSNAFRHPITIADEMFPKQWRDLL